MESSLTPGSRPGGRGCAGLPPLPPRPTPLENRRSQSNVYSQALRINVQVASRGLRGDTSRGNIRSWGRFVVGGSYSSPGRVITHPGTCMSTETEPWWSSGTWMPESAAWREDRGRRGGSGCKEGVRRGAERSWKLREHRRGAPDDADGPFPPTPGCGWVTNGSAAECHGRWRIQGEANAAQGRSGPGRQIAGAIADLAVQCWNPARRPLVDGRCDDSHFHAGGLRICLSSNIYSSTLRISTRGAPPH